MYVYICVVGFVCAVVEVFGGLFSPIPGTCDLTKKCSPSAYVVKAWSSADDATLGGAKNLRSGES